MMKIGPAGHPDFGNAWDDEGRVGITQIFVSHGDFINSLQFQFVENGNLVLSEKYGGNGSSGFSPKFHVVRIDYQSEFLTGVSGSWGSQAVSSISFSTNKSTYGPFGFRGKGDPEFEYQVGADNTFGGFHGTATAGSYLCSIGLFVKLMTTPSPCNANRDGVQQLEPPTVPAAAACWLDYL